MTAAWPAMLSGLVLSGRAGSQTAVSAMSRFFFFGWQRSPAEQASFGASELDHVCVADVTVKEEVYYSN